MASSLADDFHEHALSPPAIELAVENLLPRAEVEFALGDRHDDLASHDLPLEVSIGVVLTGPIVLVLGNRFMWGEFFQPDVVVVQKPVFRVVDEHRRADVHGIDQTKPFPNSTLADELLHRAGDIDETAALRNFKPEMFGEAFQYTGNRRPSSQWATTAKT